MNERQISVSAFINGDIKSIWNYYTDPAHITQWNFADSSWHCPSASNDMQVGGKYSARMEARDGSFGFDFEAVYLEIVNGEKFTYTMTDGRKAIVAFKSHGNSTHVSVTFDAENEAPPEMQRDGWQAILNNFKTYVETNLVTIV